MFQFRGVFIAACLLAIGNVCQSDDKALVVSNAEMGQFPYLVTFNVRPFYLNMPCAGSLISDSWILTTASCIISPLFKNFNFVTVGRVNDYTNQAWSIRVRVNDTRLYTHPHFHPVSFEHDIGLIQLPTPLIFNRYISSVKIASPHFNPPSGAIFQVIGWGNLNLGKNPYAGMKYTQVPNLYDKDTCKSKIGNYDCPTYSFSDKKLENIICSYSNLPMGLTGFSHLFGGPLISRSTSGEQIQIGITSWASTLGVLTTPPNQCNNKTAILVYTDVSAYTDWLADILKNNAQTRAVSVTLIAFAICLTSIF